MVPVPEFSAVIPTILYSTVRGGPWLVCLWRFHGVGLFLKAGHGVGEGRGERPFSYLGISELLGVVARVVASLLFDQQQEFHHRTKPHTMSTTRRNPQLKYFHQESCIEPS
jgi:hypothetical protein